jgi:hypothetical protein
MTLKNLMLSFQICRQLQQMHTMSCSSARAMHTVVALLCQVVLSRSVSALLITEMVESEIQQKVLECKWGLGWTSSSLSKDIEDFSSLGRLLKIRP